MLVVQQSDQYKIQGKKDHEKIIEKIKNPLKTTNNH